MALESAGRRIALFTRLVEKHNIVLLGNENVHHLTQGIKVNMDSERGMYKDEQ